ncbi:phage terminase small subunit [Sphingomonas sp. IC081]|uniref:phage terminase small subunit n=1 Tax=Sphingomonas sp. IC081 TaxID=304378 RepID=UPI0021AE90AC|nr:phage terminase small subunit [Sphingomonas sp. IC081]
MPPRVISPAQASYQRKLAAASRLAAAVPPTGTAAPMPETGPVATEYELLRAALGIDLSTLRNIQSTERKIEAKRTMIEKYRPWVEGAADAAAGTQDDIVSTIMIWAIDIQDWPLALKLAEYVLLAGIELPERYNRSPATLVAEEVAEAGIKDPGSVPFDVLGVVADLVSDADIFDQVRAKLEKALGLAFKARADAFDPNAESAVAGGKPALLAAAISHLDRAIALHEGSGAKKLRQAYEAELKKLGPPASPPA